jgi:hypothetical protein
MGIRDHARRAAHGTRDDAKERKQLSAGHLPDELRAALAAAGEEILLEEQGIDTFVKGVQVQFEGKLVPLKKNYGPGAVVVTDRRLLVLAAGGFEHLEVEHQHGAAQVALAVERADMLCLVYEASVATAFGAGHIELRLHTKQAGLIADLLRGLAAPE